YTIAPKEGYNLGASTVGIWAEGDGTGTGGNVFAGRPSHGRCIVSVRRHIHEAAAGGRRRRPGVAPQEGDSLAAGYHSIRTEGSSAGAGCNVLLHGPEHGLIVVGSRIHIGEGSTALYGFGGTSGPPEEGHHLCAGAGGVRAECRSGGSAGDSMLHRPLNRIRIPGVSRNVSK